MKKITFFAVMMSCAFAAFSQNPTPSDSTSLATTILEMPTKVNKLPQERDSLIANVISSTQLKEIMDAAEKNGGATIVGYNVIVGNNNTIIVVDDKSKAEQLLKATASKGDGSGKSIGKFRLSRSFFERYAVAAKVSTMGAGGEFATTIGRNMALRLGYSYMSYTSNNFDVKINDDGLKQATLTKDYYPNLNTEAQFKQSHGSALIDIFPLRNGIFHVTTGVYVGSTKVRVNGQLTDGEGNPALLDPANEGWPHLGFNDRYLNIDKLGRLDAELKMGNLVKPYLGIGIGRAIPSNRFGVKFELGMLYNGSYKISQNGKEIHKLSGVNDSFDNVDGYERLLKWWPVVNFQIIYRLK